MLNEFSARSEGLISRTVAGTTGTISVVVSRNASTTVGRCGEGMPMRGWTSEGRVVIRRGM